jgi:S1-C subfamily serine protease
LPRPRLGFGWREDSAEPGAVFLVRVVPNTPAAAAGLEVHDRIYAVNGKAFESADAFQSLITSLLDSGASELTLLVESRGHMRTVTVKLASDASREKSNVETLQQGQSTSGP